MNVFNFTWFNSSWFWNLLCTRFYPFLEKNDICPVKLCEALIIYHIVSSGISGIRWPFLLDLVQQNSFCICYKVPMVNFALFICSAWDTINNEIMHLLAESKWALLWKLILSVTIPKWLHFGFCKVFFAHTCHYLIYCLVSALMLSLLDFLLIDQLFTRVLSTMMLSLGW